MTLSERTAYLKGLMEGMKIDTESNEGKLFKAIIVGILHLLSLNESSGELGRGVQGSFGHAAGDDVAHLDANEGSALAGLHVLELDNLHNLAVHLEGNAVANIACRNHCIDPPKISLPYGIGMCV